MAKVKSKRRIKKNPLKGKMGWFSTFNPDAGNVEKNIEFFNRAMGTGDATEADFGASEVAGGGMAESLSEKKLNKIKSELEAELRKFFKADSEMMDYAGIQMEDGETEDGKFLAVTAYAEVGYRTLERIADVLDPIIQKYDKDAYFEPEDAGRLTAFVWNDKKLRESLEDDVALEEKVLDIINNKSPYKALSEDVYKLLVPIEGKAKTIAGELVRAFNRIGYRFFNDGDKFTSGYGFESALPAVAYLYNKDVLSNNTKNKIKNEIDDLDYDSFAYERFLKLIAKDIVDYINNDPDVITATNNEDCLKARSKEIEEILRANGLGNDDWYDEDGYPIDEDLENNTNELRTDVFYTDGEDDYIKYSGAHMELNNKTMYCMVDSKGKDIWVEKSELNNFKPTGKSIALVDGKPLSMGVYYIDDDKDYYEFNGRVMNYPNGKLAYGFDLITTRNLNSAWLSEEDLKDLRETGKQANTLLRMTAFEKMKRFKEDSKKSLKRK